MATNRSVKVSLVSEVNGFISGMDAAAKKTRELGTEAEKLAQKRDAINTLGGGLTAIGAVAATGVALAVKTFAEFDSAISSVQAATHATTGDMSLLRDAALDAGASTVFSATESANAIEELSKAGLTTADILGGGLTGSLDLASAGSLDVARAAEIASTTLQQFKLSGTETAHVADVLAAGAGKAMGSVEDLANGLKYVGPVAQSLGVSLEETTGTLALFAQQGIIGEQAGTSLRGVLSSLTAPSGAASEEIARLNLNLYDSQGNFLGMENAAGELSRAYSGMNDESRNASMGIIFGRETITAATALYQAGAEGVDKWTSSVNDSGYASETARLKLDNLKGDIEALGGSLETALIKTGESADTPFRAIVQGATDAVTAYSNLDDGIHTANLVIGSSIAVVGTAAGAFLLAAPKVVEFRNAIDTMGPSAQRAGKAIEVLGKTAGVATGLVTLALAADKLASSSDKAATGVEKTTSALLASDTGDLFTGLGQDVNSYSDALELLTGDSINSGIERMASTLNGSLFGGAFSDQVAQTTQQFDNMGTSLATLVQQGDAERAADIFDELATAAAKEGVSRKELEKLMPAYAAALAGVNNEQQLAKEGAEGTSDAIDVMADTAEMAAQQMDVLKESIAGLGSQQFDVNNTSRAFEAAIDDATAAVEKNGATLDIATQAGRANSAAVDAIASSAIASAGALSQQVGGQELATAAIQRGRDQVIQQRLAMGDTQAGAEAYADSLQLIPANISTNAAFVAAAAAAAAANYKRSITEIPEVWTTRLRVIEERGASTVPQSGGTTRPGFAHGGAIYGPGTGTSDDVPAWLSNGEHILTAQDVARMGGQAAVYAFREGLSDGRHKYARGGAVTKTTYSATAAAAPSVTVLPAPVSLDMPVYADGSLLGYVRGIAGQEVQFALATETTRLNQKWRPE